jgi:Na+/H+ antiporter NhaD/arsenite permease-like protein
MVAGSFQWDTPTMMSLFGWRSLLAVTVNAAAVTWLFRRELARLPEPPPASEAAPPLAMRLIHIVFLLGIVVFARHPAVFVGLFLFFLGFAHAYRRHQDPLILEQGLMIGFFLAGLVVLGAPQRWWLEPLLARMDSAFVYYGASLLTAVTDNAALTYLGSLVHSADPGYRYALVAGALTGGGLTVIANAPNPAGFAILRRHFPGEAISALGLLVAALPPTLVAVVAFRWL